MLRAPITTAAVAMMFAVGYLAEARRYAWGSAAQPGPGLYPLMVGVLLVVASLGVGVEAVARGSQDVVDWPKGSARRRAVAMLLATLGYVVLLPYIGHPVAGTLLTLVVLQVMGLRSWVPSIGLALGIGLSSYYVFARVLGVPLPLGIWFD